MIGKYINIISRISKILHKYFNNNLYHNLVRDDLIEHFLHKKNYFIQLYSKFDYSEVIRESISLMDIINTSIEQYKPWIVCKDLSRSEELHQFCTLVVNLFRILTIYLKPIIPKISIEISNLLICDLSYDNYDSMLLAVQINQYKPIINGIQLDIFSQM